MHSSGGYALLAKEQSSIPLKRKGDQTEQRQWRVRPGRGGPAGGWADVRRQVAFRGHDAAVAASTLFGPRRLSECSQRKN